MMNDPKIHCDFGIGGWVSYACSGVWKNPFPEKSDEYWMAECLVESMKSFPFSSPNPSVGAVYVKNGIEIARGHTQAYGGLHAEIHALANIDRSALKGAKLYVSLEPCSHSGKQPPCVDTLVKLELDEVIIAIQDPNPLVGGKGIEALRKASLKTRIGVLQSEAFLINLSFFDGLKNQGPAFFLKWAQSLDGALADVNGTSQWITGEKSRFYTHFLRSRYDAILVGAQTVLHDQPSLTARHSIFHGRPNPIRIIYDPKGRIGDSLPKNLQSELLRKTFSSEAKTILITTETPSKFRQELDQNGVLVLQTDHPRYVEDLSEILSSERLTNFIGKKLGSVLVEGGPQLLSTFIEKKLFTAIHCFIAPLFIGGQNRIYNTHKNLLANAFRLNSLNHFQFGSDVLLEMLPKQEHLS